MNKGQRKRIRNLKIDAFIRQDGLCAYCGKEMILPIFVPGKRTCYLKKHATAEHVIPQSLGGEAYKYYNVICSCLECNSFRHTIDHDIFIKIRKKENWKTICNNIESRRTIGYYLFYKRLIIKLVKIL